MAKLAASDGCSCRGDRVVPSRGPRGGFEQCTNLWANERWWVALKNLALPKAPTLVAWVKAWSIACTGVQCGSMPA